jgi:4,5-DOPA dioxygenase extradiol
MKMPVLFVGHGSPMNAIEQNAFTRSLREVRKKLPVAKAVCVISAHWVTRGSQVMAEQRPRTIHDFYGFPRPLYEVQYPAPGAPEVAKRIALEEHLAIDHEWGLDHGAWSVLRHLYPEADVPVFQVSLDHARTLAEHLELGRELAKQRARGVLILGSGNVVHNLHRINWEMADGGYPWAEEFDAKVKKAIDERDVKALAWPEHWGQELLGEAHPTLEHYVPLLYCLGASGEHDAVTYPYEGMEFGTISMRMVLIENGKE